MLHEVHTEVIGEEFVRWVLEYDEVALLARLDAADRIGSSYGCSPVDREGRNGFFDGHAHVEGGKGKHEGDGSREATARIEVAPQCNGTAGVDHLTGRSVVGTEAEGGTR